MKDVSMPTDAYNKWDFSVQIPSNADKNYHKTVKDRIQKNSNNFTTKEMPKTTIFHPWTHNENKFKYTHEFNENGAIGYEGLNELGFGGKLHPDANSYIQEREKAHLNKKFGE